MVSYPLIKEGQLGHKYTFNLEGQWSNTFMFGSLIKEGQRSHNIGKWSRTPMFYTTPVLSDFYTPTDEQHYRWLGFIALSMIGIGGVLCYLEI